MSTVAMTNPINALEYNLAAYNISEATIRTKLTLPHSTSCLPSIVIGTAVFQGTGGICMYAQF